MTTLFWPSDVTRDGFMYGWAQFSSLCVAGVLHADTLADAEAILADVIRTERMKALLTSCGIPVILGYCTFPSSVPGITADIQDVKSILFRARPYRFVHYQRHTASSRRYYAVCNGGPSIAPQGNGVTPMDVWLAHDFTHGRLSSSSSRLQKLVNQWNTAKVFETAIQQHQSGISGERERTPYGMSYIGISRLWDVLPNPWFDSSGGVLRLKEFSFTARQLETRLNVLRFLFSQKSTYQGNDITISCKKYNEYYNSLWVVLNDIIIGVAFRQFLFQNRLILNKVVIDNLEDILAYRIRSLLLWLDSWPAGLKLNTELSRFYSHGFIGLTAQWTKLLSSYLPYLPILNLMVENASLIGMTMTISLFLDLLSLLTAHFYACYLISSTIYQRILVLIGSLWNLFRGKRYNVLRNRTDPWDYDVDQLLLGTILFTLAAHLFPTVVVYYAVFALVVRLSLIVLYASGETLLAFMNHFPLFSLMLRIKDPQRLPGDTYLLVKRTSGHGFVTLMSCPLPLTAIFAQYTELWHRLVGYYHPIRLGMQILQGQILATFTHTSIHIPSR
ncbi:N-acetylglucosaminyl transferase component-domain-containing protein [Scleroderma yunnanense]